MKKQYITTVVAIVFAMVMLAGSANAAAETVYWDGGTTNIAGNGDGASAGGSGTWNTTTNNWDEGVSAHVAWDANSSGDDKAVFGGSVGTVDLGSDITLGEILIKDVGPYVIGDGDETYTLTFGGAKLITIDGQYATFRAGISGAPDINNTSKLNDNSSMLTLTPGASANMELGTIALIRDPANNRNQNLELNGASTANSIEAITYSGSPYGLTVVKKGVGTWAVSNVSINAGAGVKVEAGKLVLSGDINGAPYTSTGGTMEFNNSGATLAPGTLVFNGGTISNSSGGTLTFSNPALTMNANGVTFIGGDFDLGSGNATIASSDGPITVAAGTTVTIGGVINDSTSIRNLEKKGGGTLDLNGNNTYKGNTTVSEGTLSIAYPCLKSNARVYIAAGTTLDLDFSGTNDVFALFTNGVLAAAGTWGRIDSPTATYKSSLITGDGILNNEGGAAPAGVYFWDGGNYGGTGDGISDGGNGVWSISSNNWDHGLGARQVWPNTASDEAYLAGAIGTITLESDVTLRYLEFGLAGDDYTITGDYTLQFAAGGAITNAAQGKDVKISCGISGSPSLAIIRASHLPFSKLWLEPTTTTQTLGTALLGYDGTTGDKYWLRLAGTTHGNSIGNMAYGPSASYGTVEKDQGGTWTVGDITTGKMELKDGTLVVNGTLYALRDDMSFTGGTLAGTGVVNEPVTVPATVGTIAPGDPTGTLTITNNNCTINGTLAITVNGAQVSTLAVDPANTLDITTATLEVTATSASGPVVIATYGSGKLVGGSFGTDNKPSGWTIDYGTTAITLTPPPAGTLIIIQ